MKDDVIVFGGLAGMIVGVLRPMFSLKIESTPLQALVPGPQLVYGVITCLVLKKYGALKS